MKLFIHAINAMLLQVGKTQLVAKTMIKACHFVFAPQLIWVLADIISVLWQKNIMWYSPDIIVQMHKLSSVH